MNKKWFFALVVAMGIVVVSAIVYLDSERDANMVYNGLDKSRALAEKQFTERNALATERGMKLGSNTLVQTAKAMKMDSPTVEQTAFNVRANP